MLSLLVFRGVLIMRASIAAAMIVFLVGVPAASAAPSASIGTISTGVNEEPNTTEFFGEGDRLWFQGSAICTLGGHAGANFWQWTEFWTEGAEEYITGTIDVE